MSAWIGWALAAAALLVGWHQYGWQGLAAALSMIVFWLLLQFTRTMHALRLASGRPVGVIDSAVMLNARLRAGMPMADILRLTKSLGRRSAEEPETYLWADPGGSQVEVELANGRVRQWTMSRPPDS